MKGFRTIIVNAGIAAATAGLKYLLDINWVEVVGPVLSVAIIAGINMGLRFLTDTPVFKAE